jgi:hypothetical protein
MPLFTNPEQLVGIGHLDWLITATAQGELEWGHAPRGTTALGTNVGRIMGIDWSRELGMDSVRVGYCLDDSLNYITFTEESGAKHDLDPVRQPGLVSPDVLVRAERVLFVAKLAVSTESGILRAATAEECLKCEASTPHLSLYSSPYGIPGAAMEGSERCECALCGTTIRGDISPDREP